jgi:agmatine deiminase
MAADYPDVLAGIVAALEDRIELVGLVSAPEGGEAVRQVLARHGLPADAIRPVQVPSETIWIRDFGPVFVRHDGRAVLAFDLEYTRRSGDHVRDQDDRAAAAIARQFDVPVRRVPLELEQGYFLTGGGDLLVTTSEAYNINIRRGYDAATVTRCLHQMFGCRTIAVLEPLPGEPTGHVDVFACFTAPGAIALGRHPSPADRADAAVLERNAAILASLRVSGEPLRVVRLPMPTSDEGVWRSYTNVVFANGALLVPQYGGHYAESDAAALRVFRGLLPQWQIVGIDAGTLIRGEGALRCVTLVLPAAGD